VRFNVVHGGGGVQEINFLYAREICAGIYLFSSRIPKLQETSSILHYFGACMKSNFSPQTSF
jgi:hypothetical protein